MSLFEDVAALYEGELRVPVNNVCRLRCDARFKRPLLPWHVGEKYGGDARRLVVIRRPHRGDDPAEDRPSGTQDGRATADRFFRTKRWPFWRFAREVLGRVYGSEEEGWSRIALTTIVKCANSTGGTESNDRTSSTMKLCCIGQVGVIRQELAILDPKTIVLFTGRDYDDWLKELRWARDQEWRDVGGRSMLKACGDAPLPWWECEIAGGGESVRVLRVGDPRGKPLEAFATMLAGWITGLEKPRPTVRAAPKARRLW